MSTDSTELTFVRCPSCRSLVPAISTRCRMCGASLDASGKPDDQEADSRKQSRVRQRTMSQPRSELSSAAGQIRQEEVVEVEELGAPVSDVPVAESAGEDPLGSYIEEVEENGNGRVAVDAQPEAQDLKEDFAASEEDDFEDDQEPLEAATPSEQPGLGRAEEDSERFDLAQPPEEAPAAARPRVIVESGTRRMGRGGGLSFGKSREEKSETPAAPAVEREAKSESEALSWKPVAGQARGAQGERRPADSRRPVGGSDKFRVPEREPRDATRPVAPAVQTRPEIEGRVDRTPPPQQQTASRRPAEPVDRKAEELKPSEGVKGRLFGWLVSYSNPDGTAIELREGRFFVTRSSLKPTDLIVNDESVSTPHALINVGADGKFQMQDLMSDRGIFVRRRGGDTYQREDATVVQHGDWVRFGDVEFLVCLIAHVGAK